METVAKRMLPSGPPPSRIGLRGRDYLYRASVTDLTISAAVKVTIANVPEVLKGLNASFKVGTSLDIRCSQSLRLAGRHQPLYAVEAATARAPPVCRCVSWVSPLLCDCGLLTRAILGTAI